MTDLSRRKRLQGAAGAGIALPLTSRFAMGLPVDLSEHQIPSGRLYRYSPETKRMEPASDWIRV